MLIVTGDITKRNRLNLSVYLKTNMVVSDSNTNTPAIGVA
jgi:hypothetical protein